MRHFRHVDDNTIWQYVLTYNRLTPKLVNTLSVSAYRGKLTQIVKLQAQQGDESWRQAYQSCENVNRLFHARS